MKTTRQMFGKVVRDLTVNERAYREDLEQRLRYVAEQEARLDEPLTRRDVLGALETVASEYGGNGNHDSDLIADAFRKLRDALT